MSYSYWLFVALTVLITSALCYVTYKTSLLLKQWTPDRNLLLLPSENLVRVALILISLILGLLSGLPYAKLGWTLDKWPAMLLQGSLWGAGLALAILLTTRILVRLGGSRFYSDAIVQAMLPRSRKELALTVPVLVGVVVGEELLFRSLLLGGLEPIASQMLLLVITSLLFGFMHLPQGLWGVIGAAAAGAVMGWLFIRTGSILVPIAAHYVTNLLQILVASWERRDKLGLSG